jgi:polysaccharide pyruvyl transferase WcaK-like protein
MSSPLKILVVGYYNHSNLGDEQYKVSIEYVLKKAMDGGGGAAGSNPDIKYVDCDTIMHQEDVDENTIVVLGGGDVINHYFLDKLNDFIRYYRETKGTKIRCIAFSVGVPYNDIFIQPEHARKLSILEHVFLRTRQDIGILEDYIEKHGLSTRVHYLPDTSCMLMDVVSITPADTKGTKKRTIGIMLTRHIYSNKSPECLAKYNNMVWELSRLIDNLVSLNFHVVLVPFNTNSRNDQENDVLIQNDVYSKLRVQTKRSVVNIEHCLEIGDMFTLFQSFYLTIPMRFHATLFSVYCQIPMIPLFCTKKIRNFLKDIQWTEFHIMEKDECDVPTKINCYEILRIFRVVVQTKKYMELKRKMRTVTNYMRTNVEEKYETIRDVIMRESPPEAATTNQESLAEPGPLVEEPAILVEENPYQSLLDRINQIAKDHGYLEGFQQVVDPEIQSLIVSVVSHELTGTIDSSYNYGLMEKMFQPGYNYQEEWKWIKNECGTIATRYAELKETFPITLVDIPPPPPILHSPYVSEPERKRLNIMFKDIDVSNEEIDPSSSSMPRVPPFNIFYIDQNDRSGAHRSGWKFVYDNIKQYSDPNSPVLLDLYVDRTFHWKREIYKHLGIIPYKQPWFGVIHHTFDTSFSEYNNHVLLKCPEFLESLATCQGIIVLSKYLRGQFLDYFIKNSNVVKVPRPIPVCVATHPTEMNGISRFDYSTFCTNRDKKLIHIGGWLRNIFSFYQLRIDSIADTTTNLGTPEKCSWWKSCFGGGANISTMVHDRIPIRRVILKGKNMNNYFPDLGSIEMVHCPKPANQTPTKYCSQDLAATPIKNNWLKHMFDYMEKLANDPSIEILEHVGNHEYDELLTKNLVFIHLVDGSAINTVIECFVRNTPIVVNRHPAVEEVLGTDYPLYYQEPTCESIDRLLHTDNIRKAHLHMLKMVKTPFHIDTFRNKLFRILETI